MFTCQFREWVNLHAFLYEICCDSNSERRTTQYRNRPFSPRCLCWSWYQFKLQTCLHMIYIPPFLASSCTFLNTSKHCYRFCFHHFPLLTTPFKQNKSSLNFPPLILNQCPLVLTFASWEKDSIYSIYPSHNFIYFHIVSFWCTRESKQSLSTLS